MRHTDGYLDTVRDTNIYHQHWLPEEAPKAGLLVVHGLAEHSGRYMNIVQQFVPSGYAVYGIDHIGHGKSDGERVFVDRFQDYVITLKKYVDMIRNWQPDKPLFLIGHSMGGLIASAYMLEHQHDLTGAVLSGPGVKVPDNISKIVILAGKVLSILMPKAGILQLDAEGISRDPAVVDAYKNDPMVYTGKITARLGAEMLKTMQHVTDKATEITLPIYIVQGGADKLIDPGGAQLLYDRVGSADKTLKMYDGFYHEVFNEPEHDRVLKNVQQWIETRLAER